MGPPLIDSFSGEVQQSAADDDPAVGVNMNSKICRKRIVACFVAVVAFAFNPLILAPLYAQVAGATLSGTVVDQSGAGIPNAQVSIKNVATGSTRYLTTDAAGFYTAPNLLPGATTPAIGLTRGFFSSSLWRQGA